MWDVMGGLGWSAGDGFSIVAGYRGAGVDYRNNGSVCDVIRHGPLLGFVFNFQGAALFQSAPRINACCRYVKGNTVDR
ncbi:MAG: hypothetical protein AB7F74_08625 [Parvibaculaceae bacterium]